MLGPSVGVVVLLFYLIATGVIAVSFTMSGIPFTLNADNLSGNGFVQYATVDTVTNNTAQGTGQLPPASVSGANVADTVTVLASGTITKLDQTICAPISPLGGAPYLQVEIKAGDPAVTSSRVSFSNLVANAPLLTANQATFTNINIGQDLGSALGIANNGQFAQAAQSVSIDNVHQVAIGTSAGSFTLPGLTLSASFHGACTYPTP